MAVTTGRARSALRLMLAVSLAFHVGPALAEVADKAPDISQLWLAPAVLTVGACALAKWRPLLALLVLPVSLLLALERVRELHDVSVGPAIQIELGTAYSAHVYLASLAAVAGPVLAYAAFSRRKSRDKR